jgi:hypothetical protein
MDNFDAVRELPVKPKQDSPVNPSGEPEAARMSGAEPYVFDEKARAFFEEHFRAIAGRMHEMRIYRT